MVTKTKVENLRRNQEQVQSNRNKIPKKVNKDRENKDILTIHLRRSTKFSAHVPSSGVGPSSESLLILKSLESCCNGNSSSTGSRLPKVVLDEERCFLLDLRRGPHHHKAYFKALFSTRYLLSLHVENHLLNF